MKKTRRRVTSWLLLLISAVGLCSGCRNEAYFGPYQLDVPTKIEERSAGHTFQMPLTESESQQREQLASCEANEPGRPLPCRCDYPVLTVGKELTRLDYRLTHMLTKTSGEAGGPVNVMVWIGVNVQPGADLPSVLPDLPQVEVLSEHLHVLMPGAVLDEGFLESEWTEMEQAWTGAHFPECTGSIGKRPAPYEVLIGLSLPADSKEQVTLEYTVRVRSGR
jgi:hypothetical protein